MKTSLFFKLYKGYKSIHSHKTLLVFVIALIVALLSIFHIFTLKARTPNGFFFTGVGHYYLDYFVYLQVIVQGMRGRWLPVNYIATDDGFTYLLFLPFLFIGKCAKLLHVSPVFAYWGSVALLNFLLVIVIYIAIRLFLEKKPFYLRVCALLITIFTGPFYRLIKTQGTTILAPFDFWFGPTSFFRRFETVPSHALVSILFVVIILILASFYKNIQQLSFKRLVLYVVGINGSLSTILLISGSTVLLPLTTIFITSFFYFTIFVLRKKPRQFFLLLFIFLVIIWIIPLAFILKMYYSQSFVLTKAAEFEESWRENPSLLFLFLNLGPIIVFFPFAIKSFFKSLNPIRIITFSATLLSYGLFLSPVSKYLGIHNLRFILISNYIFFGAFATLGIEKIASLLKERKQKYVLLITTLLLFIFSILNIYNLYLRIIFSDPKIPMTKITYLPKDLMKSFQILNSEPGNKAILTEPYSYMGMVIPVYVDKRVYVGRTIDTPFFEEKSKLSYQFLSGLMPKQQALNFLRNNQIGFVLLTSIDNGDYQSIAKYSFLKEIYRNRDSVIFKVM
jgi:hypothetical protein